MLLDDDPAMKRILGLFGIVAVLLSTSSSEAQTNSIIAPALAIQPTVSPSKNAPAQKKVVAKKVVKSKAQKFVWADAPKELMPLTTMKGTPIQVPYFEDAKGKRTIALKIGNDWKPAKTHEQELQAVANQLVKAQSREDWQVAQKKK